MHKLELKITELENKLKKMAHAQGVVSFSKSIELHKTDVSNWLKGRKKWSYTKILRIADKLEV
jgi:hypothetical protein